ncbi:MAG: hypothetical protein ACR2O6_00500 [Ilumatobacteraceae bacterium]
MRRIASLAVAVVLVAAACGDDSGGGQAQTEEGAQEAVERATEGALRGNADAVLNFLSQECRETVDDDEVRLAVGLIPAFFSDLFEDFDLGDIEVATEVVSFEDTTAEIEVTYVAPDGTDVDTIGLSSESFDVVYEDGKWVDTECEFEDTSERDAELLQEGLDELGYAGTRDDPVPTSVGAPVGNGFVVSVDALDADARAALEATGGFIAEPEPGTQFVLISLTVGFEGTDEPRSLSELNTQIIGGSSSVGVDAFGCGSFPTQLINSDTELFGGGVTTGDVCFAVPSEDVPGMLLSIEGGFIQDEGVVFDPTVAADTPVPVEGSTGPAAEGSFTEARLAPAPLGEAVDLGEGWTIAVRGFEEDATAELVAASDFNDPPEAGSVYSLLDYELTYDGTEASNSPFAVDVGLVGGSNVSANANCGLSEVPGGLDRFAEIFQGGTAGGTQCFVVDEGDLASIVVYASADFFSDDAFALAVR